jgi:hypothetical protein
MAQPMPLANPMTSITPPAAMGTSPTPLPVNTQKKKISSKARSYLFASKPKAGGPQSIQSQKFATQGNRLRKPISAPPGL